MVDVNILKQTCHQVDCVKQMRKSLDDKDVDISSIALHLRNGDIISVPFPRTEGTQGVLFYCLSQACDQYLKTQDKVLGSLIPRRLDADPKDDPKPIRGDTSGMRQLMNDPDIPDISQNHADDDPDKDIA